MKKLIEKLKSNNSKKNYFSKALLQKSPTKNNVEMVSIGINSQTLTDLLNANEEKFVENMIEESSIIEKTSSEEQFEFNSNFYSQNLLHSLEDLSVNFKLTFEHYLEHINNFENFDTTVNSEHKMRLFLSLSNNLKSQSLILINLNLRNLKLFIKHYCIFFFDKKIDERMDIKLEDNLLEIFFEVKTLFKKFLLLGECNLDYQEKMNVKISYLGYLNMNKSADSVDSRLILKTHKKKFLHLMNSMLDKILLAVNNFKENIDQKSLHKKEPEILPSPYYELKNQLKEMSENKIYSEQQYLSKYNEKLFNKQGDVINEDNLKKNPNRKRSVSFSDNDINESRISTTSQRTLGTSVSARGRNSDSYKRRGSVDERKNSLINSCGDAKQNNIQNQIDFYASRQNSLEKFKNFKFHYSTEDVTKENLLEGLKLEFTNVNMYLEWEPNLVLKKNMLDKKQNSRSFGESLNSVTILNLLKKLHLKETKNFTLTLRFKLFIDLKNFDLIFKFVENDALIHDEKFEEEFANLPLILDKNEKSLRIHIKNATLLKSCHSIIGSETSELGLSLASGMRM